MKKILLVIFALGTLVFPQHSFAQSDWVINNFSSNIDVLKSGQVKVIENIDVDFNIEKHGIYRDLPYVYQNGDKKLYTNIDNIQVNQDGQKAQTQITKNENNLRIRIGDADKTITGPHKYQISYLVTGVIKPFDEFDELYWNVTGNAWDAEIIHASAKVAVPGNSITQVTCFEGPLNSTNNCNFINSSSSATFSNKNALYPTYGLTIVTDFKKGTVPILTVSRPKTFIEKLVSWPSISTLVISITAGIVAIIYLWWNFGRDYWTSGISGYSDKKAKGVKRPIFGAYEPVVVEFTPPEKLPPALIGLIVDERADTLDVTATIIDLASRGYLTITEIPKKWIFGSVDYNFKKTNKDRKNLLNYEKELLERLFIVDEIKMSELKLKFYDDLKKVKDALYSEAIERGYFSENPEKVRGKYLAIGIVVLFISIFALIGTAAFEIIYIADLAFAAILIGIILIIFSRFMPRRTAYGREIYRRIKGYRMFIDRAESYKQKFFENKNIFTDILPYTIVFGMTQKFAKDLNKMGYKPSTPSWYSGTHPFNVIAFSSSVNNFSSSVGSAIASAPSSSGSGGGGFSGGGFGGGGGGSW